ncbi:unnamed protein product [Ectocarpus sp. 12 AP-2014]
MVAPTYTLALAKRIESANRIEACWLRGCLLRVRRASTHYTAGVGGTKNRVDRGLNQPFSLRTPLWSGENKEHWGKRGWQLRGTLTQNRFSATGVFRTVQLDGDVFTRYPTTDPQHGTVVLVVHGARAY